ncbi:hypothetical protein FF36_00027 [Frankia torreyi]|uniref:Uncharacterized protein n=1 Tax=Frankia torreyi TaxID=1856 RepID=A0A0D8BN23_9ACTN|nr:hypothetical protein FF36_00027 [Frankia torreyi]KQM04774.1 hypothetical protein FF86_102229 [Frankia sp. CpI1-P]
MSSNPARSSELEAGSAPCRPSGVWELLQSAADDLKVRGTVTLEPAAGVSNKVRRTQDDQPKTLGWYELLAAAVIDGPLLAAMDTAHRQPVGLVEVGSRPVVLDLAVLDHEAVVRPVGIDRQTDSPARLAWVAE